VSRPAGLAVVAGAVALAALLPLGLSGHHTHVLIQILLAAYLGYCWNVLGGFAGQLSFGHALFMAVGAYTSTVLLLGAGVSPWIGMVAGGLLAAALGLFIGYLSFRYGIKGTYFGLVTLAFAEIARNVALNWGAIGGAMGLYIPIQGNDAWNLKFIDKAGYYHVVLAFLLMALGVTAWLERSRIGHCLKAIRENEDAAQALGVNLMSGKLFATALSAFMTALGGTLYAHYVTFIDPHTLLNLNVALEITIYAIVGGVGTLWGPLLGAAVLVPLAEAMRAWLGRSYAGIHLVVYGTVLMAIVMFAPDGFMGFLRRLRAWARAPGRGAPVRPAIDGRVVHGAGRRDDAGTGRLEADARPRSRS
jgi:branched-chain amino acid transport system permease protein